MSLANPWGLLALLALPLVIYLHRRSSGDARTVPLVALWRPTAAGPRRGAWRQRPDAVLLLRLAIVVGIALALARPAWPVGVARRHVLLVDASASMRAREHGGTRLTAAVAEARRILDGLPAGDPVSIVRGAVPPIVLHGFSTDRHALATALASLEPGDGAKDLLPALTVAGAALGRGGGLVHVFSDLGDPERLVGLGRRAGLRRQDVSLHPVGTPADNVAIVRLESAPLARSPLDHEVFTEVANFSPVFRTVEITLSAANGHRERRLASLAAWQRATVTFVAPPAPWIEVSLGGTGDALDVDDRATAILESPRLRVLHAGGDAFVDAALRAHPRLEVRRLSPTDLGPERWRDLEADLVVVDAAAVAADFPLPVLAFAPPGAVTRRLVPLVDWQRSHPLLRGLDLEGVAVPAGAVLGAAVRTIVARSEDGPVVGLATSPRRRIDVGFAAAAGTFARSPAFPVFVARAIDWLVDRRPSLALRPGQPLRVEVPAGEAELAIHRPDGATARVRPVDGILGYTDTGRVGRYDVAGRHIAFSFAVNLLDDDESNLSRPALVARGSGTDPVAAPGVGEAGRAVAAVALQLLSFEIWLLQRQARRRNA